MSAYRVMFGRREIIVAHVRDVDNGVRVSTETSSVVMGTRLDGFYMVLLDDLLARPKFRRALREKLPKRMEDF